MDTQQPPVENQEPGAEEGDDEAAPNPWEAAARQFGNRLARTGAPDGRRGVSDAALRQQLGAAAMTDQNAARQGRDAQRGYQIARRDFRTEGARDAAASAAAQYGQRMAQISGAAGGGAAALASMNVVDPSERFQAHMERADEQQLRGEDTQVQAEDSRQIAQHQRQLASEEGRFDRERRAFNRAQQNMSRGPQGGNQGNQQQGSGGEGAGEQPQAPPAAEDRVRNALGPFFDTEPDLVQMGFDAFDSGDNDRIIRFLDAASAVTDQPHSASQGGSWRDVRRTFNTNTGTWDQLEQPLRFGRRGERMPAASSFPNGVIPDGFMWTSRAGQHYVWNGAGWVDVMDEPDVSDARVKNIGKKVSDVRLKNILQSIKEVR